LIHTGVWGSGIALVFILLIAKYTGPETDFFYQRFTGPKASSMILGSSRAAQGMIPSVLAGDGIPHMFNYSFTNYNSPYGLCYLKAAKKKFSKKRGGLFILEVNPFTLSNYERNMAEDEEVFEECSTLPSNMVLVDQKPNYEYILRNYSEDIRTLIGLKERDVASYLHDDGWLEIKMSFDTAYFRLNTVEKVRIYDELIKKMKPSEARWQALRETVEYFGDYGRVYLVRVPISRELAKIEAEYYPDFGKDMAAFASEAQVSFLDYGDLMEELYFTDGNHLHRISATVFSQRLKADLLGRGL